MPRITDISDIVEDNRRKIALQGSDVDEIVDVESDEIFINDQNIKIVTDIEIEDANTGDTVLTESEVPLTFEGRQDVVDILLGNISESLSNGSIAIGDGTINNRREQTSISQTNNVASSVSSSSTSVDVETSSTLEISDANELAVKTNNGTISQLIDISDVEG
jgi:hypothetical protein